MTFGDLQGGRQRPKVLGDSFKFASRWKFGMFPSFIRGTHMKPAYYVT